MPDRRAIIGPILAFVGGFVILVYAALELWVSYYVSGVTSVNGLPVSGPDGLAWGGGLGLLFGFLVMLVAVLAGLYPEQSAPLGAMAILFSVLSLVSFGGGAGVGLLLGVLGGALSIGFSQVHDTRSSPSSTIAGRPTTALVRPTTSLPPAAPTDATASGPASARVPWRACSNCGQVQRQDATVCARCGQALPTVPGSASTPGRQP